MITYILIAVGVLLLIFVIAAFNSLSKRRNQIENAISSLDALFIQRSDLIPNLIATTKEYMAYEQDTFRQITELRRPVQPTLAENPYLEPDELSGILCYKPKPILNLEPIVSLCNCNTLSVIAKSNWQRVVVTSVLPLLITTTAL